ncbi:ceramide phosphoethanolamine synthase-like isoform X1 [Physella acuta]|uniref:ceramide phosphoethanolamine synthase-like isoform X1 n=2 Tax=Physella acuta TaxID=109671 RepID=UPI0027DC13D5|nr:ceramide phosphoethanolamine synthase-like isoform X1 [Physella acuta]
MPDLRLAVVTSEDQSQPTQLKNAHAFCPCPQLTAYWTPPPSWPRRICCCETLSKMSFLGLSVFRDAKTTCIFVGLILITYYFIMDIILFMRFRNVDIVADSKPGAPDELYSPFTHLSVKALMNDHTSQYIISPSAEYFDTLTQFSTRFSFITPNIISFTHLFLGLLSGKFVASENLHDRRVGVVIFQIRSWLDAFDGVVFRSQSGTHLQFQSVRATTGYYVDTTCDALGGVFLCFGILFYLWKRFDPVKQDLPTWSKAQEAASKTGLVSNGHSVAPRETYSIKYLFWKVFCYGLCLACAGKFWDLVVGDFKEIFQTPLKDPKMSMLQFELCHSTTTVVLFYLWRILEGQALLQYILIPIIIDKIWEFLNYTQYILLSVIVGLYIVSLLYIRHLRTVLNL